MDHDEIFLKYLKKKDVQFVYFNVEINFFIVIKLFLGFRKLTTI